jgi:hypothetical protein
MAQQASNDQQTPTQGTVITDLPGEIQTMILKYHLETFPAKTIALNAHGAQVISIDAPNTSTEATNAIPATETGNKSTALDVLLTCRSFYEHSKLVIDTFPLYKLRLGFSRADEAFRVWDAAIDYAQVRRLQLTISFAKYYELEHPSFQGQLDKIAAKLSSFTKATQIDLIYISPSAKNLDFCNRLAYDWARSLRVLPGITGFDHIFIEDAYGQRQARSYVFEHEKRGARWQIHKRDVASKEEREQAFRRYGIATRGSDRVL